MIVLKIGGSILEKFLENDNFYSIVKQLNEQIVIVHGGGNYLDLHADRFNYTKKFITSPEGIRSRYTDKDTLDVFTMVMNLINEKIVLNLKTHGINGITLNGVLNARRKEKLIIMNENNRKMIIDGGYTGKIENVDSSAIKALLDSGYVPVISPVAYGKDSYLNVDADRAAAYIAGSLGADTLMFLTNVNGLYFNNSVIQKADTAYIKSILNGIGNGMDKKLMASLEALDFGVKKVLISNPFNNIYEGTVISNEL
ncbi:MAG: [LysW]-aminoadipate/[LysW]-glutamate kinase [Ferroplasma sp.]